VYERECAACHGLRGEGQPNWQVPLPDGSLPAPPHDTSGHTWHHSDALLTEIILKGGVIFLPQSKMPGYQQTLTRQEIAAVLAYIKTWWGPEELAFQAEQNAAAGGITAVPPSPTVPAAPPR
jgi:mono/diheme cytochrome c family protein